MEAITFSYARLLHHLISRLKRRHIGKRTHARLVYRLRLPQTSHARRTVRSLTLNKRAISAIARRSSSRIRLTSFFYIADRAGGLPPIRPRFRAEASPSLVRSEIRSRSNWAIEAKT